MEGVGGVFQGFQDLPSVKEILENEPVNKDHKLKAALNHYHVKFVTKLGGHLTLLTMNFSVLRRRISKCHKFLIGK